MSRFRPRAQSVLAFLFTAALLGPPLAVGLADLSGVGHRWTDLAAQFSAPAALAALVVTLGLALLRQRPAILAGAATTLICALAAAPQAFPERREVEAGAPTIRMYSANLYVLNDDVDAIAASVRAARPDVLILIEAGDAPFAALARIAPELTHRVASPRIDWRGSGARTVIASRWPLGGAVEEADVHALTATVRSPLGPLKVTGVHLTRPWPYQVQWEQIRQIEALGRTTATGRPASRVIAGDFNSVTDARVGRAFAERSGMTPAPAFPGSWPADLPAALGVGIDNVWVTRDLAVIDRGLGRPNGSDHRPIVTVVGRARP